MMENNEHKHYATVGTGSEQRKIEIIDFVQAQFADHRVVHVAELVDGTFTMAIENPVSSGRNPHQAIRLGKESFVALLFTAHLYIQGKGVNLIEMMEGLDNGKDIDYTYSSGLKPFEAKPEATDGK